MRKSITFQEGRQRVQTFGFLSNTASHGNSMLDLIKRNTPLLSELTNIEYIEKDNGNGVYEIDACDGRLVLRGDCKISLAVAYNRYLKDYLGVNLSHCGNNTVVEPKLKKLPLPDKKIRQIIIQDKRACMSFPSMSYSACWWNWERWEREIDFMAMNGVNMPLATTGSEAVWYFTLHDMGLSQQYALDCLSGPAFWSWQLTGNMSSYFPLVDPIFIKHRVELGKKILERENELGMTPVVQGFWGNIPKRLIGLIKDAKTIALPSWCDFPATLLLDPDCPAFKAFGTALMNKQKELFGDNHCYAINPLYEIMGADTKYAELCSKLGRSVTALFNEFDAQAQLIVNSNSAHKTFIENIPQDKLIIFDIDGEGHKKSDGYGGAQFILGTLHNRGGRNALFGDIHALADNSYLEVKKNYPNAVGTGVFPEALEQNPLYYDLAYEMMTADGKVDLSSWLKSYALRRYGSDEECLQNAVTKLYKTCYSEKNTGREPSSIICARPSTELPHTAPYDELELFYDNKELFSAAELLLKAENASKDGYRFDVCDVLRQALSNLAKDYYKLSMKGYKEKDVRLFEHYSNAFLMIIEDMDRLLKTVPQLTLQAHMDAARGFAKIDADKMNFEMNQLIQITFWGPIGPYTLYDYAWREWGDFVGTYYLNRWRAYYKLLASHFTKRRLVNLVTKKQIAGRNEFRGNKVYKRYEKLENYWISHYKPSEPSDEDTIDVAKELVNKYRDNIAEL